MIFPFLQAVLAFVIVLAPLVFIHELGHFLAAKAFGVGVPVFSLGFGPRLFGFRRRETDYRVSLIPLGGYVRMTGDESDEARSGRPDEFLAKPRWQRFVVYVAGAAFNIVLALLALWLFFILYGKEAPLSYPTIFAVEEGSQAEAVGLRPGDRIVAIAGQDVLDAEVFWDTYLMEVSLSPDTVVPVVVERAGERIEVALNTGSDPRDGSGSPGWSFTRQGADAAVIEDVFPGDRAQAAGFRPGDRIVSAGGLEPISQLDLQFLIMGSAGQELEFEVERGDETVSLRVVPRLNEETGRGWIGIRYRPSEVPRLELTVGEAAIESLRTNLALSKTLFVVLKRLVTMEVSLRTMSGPIGIAQHARQALVIGPDALLYMLGFFSLQLGILNLLPIPVLDGGHLLLLGVESVMRRELSERLKERFMQAGLVFLLAFMAVILYLDVHKMF